MFSFVQEGEKIKLMNQASLVEKTSCPAEPETKFHCKYLGVVETLRPFPQPGELTPTGFVDFSTELAGLAVDAGNKALHMSQSVARVSLSESTFTMVDMESLGDIVMIRTPEILSFKAIKSLPGVKHKGVKAIALLMAKSSDNTVEIHRIGFSETPEVVRFFNRLRTAFKTIYRETNPESDVPASLMSPTPLTEDTEC